MTPATLERCPPGDSRQPPGIPACFALRELARVATAALTAALVCSPLFLASRPKTPLRVLCIAAFEFLARLRGRSLGKLRRLAIALACDFGSMCDDFYDHGHFNATQYRSLRCELKRFAPEAATSRYIQQLRQAERGRPLLSACDPEMAQAAIAYRSAVLDLSLRWMQAISGLRLEAIQFQALLDLVCLIQMADDLLDWKDDQAHRCPSYVTAFLLDQRGNGLAIPLRAQADGLLRRIWGTPKQDVGAAPFAIAGVLTWTLVVVLLKVRFPQRVRLLRFRSWICP
jgi:hypothetical protein